ncbi:MAG: LamG-like jellyroll fold domain-containing protein [Promethearchaeota archaeon]
MKKHNKKKISLIILSFLLIQAISSSLIQNVNDSDNSDTNNLMKTEEGLNNNILDSIPIASAGETPLTWWNGSYDYRLRVEINNSNSFSESKPIDLFLTFTSGNAHKDSVRVAKFTVSGEVESWTLMPCQVWNSTMAGNFLLTATITFVENNLIPGSNIYYIYYDPVETYDPTDFSGNTFSTTLTGNNLVVDWDDAYGKDYHLEMDEYYGAYKLEDNYGVNRYTGNSTSPGVIDLEKDLVGYWSFDDETPQEQTGNVPGGAGVGYVEFGNQVYYDPGKFGQALFLGGRNDYVAINGDESLYGGKGYSEGITVMSWVKPVSASGERIIVSWDRDEYWCLSLYSDTQILWATTSGDYDEVIVTSPFNLLDGEWHHIAATYDPITSSKSVYVDGVLVSNSSAHGGYDLGYSSYPARYGFIGTGSEANSFNGAVGPTDEWKGGLDDMRIYSAALDSEDINISISLPGRISSILRINEVVQGDVMSVYDVSWDLTSLNSSLTMNVTDTWWFYRSLNAWKVNRTYWWNNTINPIFGNRFAAWNTFFNWETYDSSLITQDMYYYDDQMHEGHSNVDFSPENYTVLHDYDGDNLYTAMGLFITDKYANRVGMTFNDLKWKINVDDTDDIINFVPGNETDLDTNTIGSYPLYSIGIDFWSYIRNDVDSYTSTSNAKDYFDDYYQSLTTEPIITVGQEQFRILNFEVNVYDHDGNFVPGVNVTLLNNTDGKYYDSYLTDEDGNVTFYDIPEETYKVNLTYDPFEGSNILSLGEHIVTVDQTKSVSYLVDMTSLVLQFESLTQNPLIGAEIKFKENSTGTDVVIGSGYTDDNGNVTLRWTNFTTDTKINFTCYFLGSLREFNITGGPPYDYNASVPMDSISYYNVSVKIEDFETTLTVLDDSPVDAYDQTYWNQTLQYNITYSYNNVTDTFPIEGANVSYTIQLRDTIIDEGYFDLLTDGNGNSNYTFDYAYYESILQAGTAYTLRINVNKDGYTPMVGVTNIEFTNLNTSLTLNGAITSIDWKQNITLSVFYNDEYNVDPINGANVSFVDIYNPEINGVLNPDGGGWYSIELNSSETFIGTGQTNLEITAIKQNYETQTYNYNFDITEMSTSLTIEDASIEVYWNYNFSITVFFEEVSTGDGLDNADVSWSLVSNPSISGFLERNISKGPGWYSAIVNTSLFLYARDYILEIKADIANYQSLSAHYIQLSIMEIETQIKLNDNDPTSGLYTLSITLQETDNFEFSFTYINELTSQNIADTSIQLFSWDDTSTADLPSTGHISIVGDQYTLDFNTTTLDAGSYILLVTLGEINYEQKQAMIFLTIEKRIISYDLTGDFDGQSLIKVAGNALLLSVNLNDDANGNPLLNATVIITFDDGKAPITLSDDDNDGIYTANVTYSKEEINAFFRDNTFTGNLTISAEHYSQIEKTISITIKMDEIFNGFPTFYLLLGGVGLVILVGSLVGYKLVQNARIPAFVKMVDKVISDISGKKPMSDEDISVSDEGEIIEKFDENWKLIDLDLNEILGLTKESIPSDETLSSSEEATGGI